MKDNNKSTSDADKIVDWLTTNSRFFEYEIVNGQPQWVCENAPEAIAKVRDSYLAIFTATESNTPPLTPEEIAIIKKLFPNLKLD